MLVDKKKFSLFNPVYIESRSLYENLSLVSNKIKGNVLDIGCGGKPYERIFTNSKKYVGIDHINSKRLINNKADFYFDGIKLPFKSNYFDSIVCTQVFEHVCDLDGLIKEMRRVLKKNGVILLTVPFFWEEHEIPNDFRRFSKYGIISYLEKNKFYISYYKKSTNSIITILQLNNNLLNSKLSNFFLLNLFFKLLIILNNFLALFFWNYKGNGLFYLSNVVIAKKRC